MAKQPKLLLLSAPVGAGHTRAAQALAQGITTLRPDVQTVNADVFDFFSAFWGQTLLKGYLQCLKVFPASYGKMYDWGNSSPVALWGREVVSAFLAARMLRYIETIQPTMIVCTHATPAGLVAYLKKQKKLNIPAVAVVTDYVVHRLWLYEEIDHYFVAHDALTDVLAAYGIAVSKISAAGIPIAATFAVNQGNSSDGVVVPHEKKTILVMGGGAGVLPMTEILLALNKLTTPVRVIAVTGNNRALHQSVDAIKDKLTFDLQLTGFVDHIADLMAAADVLISKPGGMTVAEALSMKLPLVIYRPIPGQEQGNAKFLITQQVAVQAENAVQLPEVLERLFADNSRLLNIMKQNAGKSARAQAAQVIAQQLLDRYY